MPNVSSDELNRFIKGLFEDGLIAEKIVKKATPTSGAIYVPKRFVGYKFRVILIPVTEHVNLLHERLDETEYNVKVLTRLIEKVTGRKIRTLLEENKEEFDKIREEMNPLVEEVKGFGRGIKYFVSQKDKEIGKIDTEINKLEEQKQEIEESKIIKIETEK